VYALEDWLASLLNTQSEVPVLALLFLVGLVILPLILLGFTGWLSRRWAGRQDAASLIPWTAHHTYALVPMGLGIWLAHYGFHFLTGFWTFVPVVQSFVADVTGWALLGAPRWDLGPLVPAGWLYPLELGLLGLGWFGALLVSHRLAEKNAPRSPWRVFAPWAVLLTLLLGCAVWLMAQPMEMRGTFLAG
jgi:hypothetical protein